MHQLRGRSILKNSKGRWSCNRKPPLLNLKCLSENENKILGTWNARYQPLKNLSGKRSKMSYSYRNGRREKWGIHSPRSIRRNGQMGVVLPVKGRQKWRKIMYASKAGTISCIILDNAAKEKWRHWPQKEDDTWRGYNREIEAADKRYTVAAKMVNNSSKNHGDIAEHPITKI